jgi:hypothetical protein
MRLRSSSSRATRNGIYCASSCSCVQPTCLVGYAMHAPRLPHMRGRGSRATDMAAPPGHGERREAAATDVLSETRCRPPWCMQCSVLKRSHLMRRPPVAVAVGALRCRGRLHWLASGQTTRLCQVPSAASATTTQIHPIPPCGQRDAIQPPRQGNLHTPARARQWPSRADKASQKKSRNG